MDFNFFQWIREGVKQSVLLGVSDAVESIGTPDNSEDISPRLLEFMRNTDSSGHSTSGGSSPRRKRLGRSLKDLETAKDA
jgi:hypothetical protein